jgi:hypothetical protein
MLAHHVYWLGLSLDKACEIIHFYTQVPITKSHADKNRTTRVPADARKIRSRLTIPMDSPVYDFLGIKPLPMESMGLYTDEVRTEIPKIPVTPFFVLE